MNQKAKGIIGILTGGGDVPGLNPAIRAVTIRALREGYKVIGIRRGWKGLVDVIRDKKVDNSCNYFELTEEIVNKAGRTGGTFLHSSRTRASHVPQSAVPEHLKDKYNAEINDLTPEVLKNLEFIGIDYLIPIGGDDTLSYAVRLSQEGVKVVAIPKTMDNDVPGTDYCIGFSTCITRTIELTHDLRTCAGSHERTLCRFLSHVTDTGRSSKPLCDSRIPIRYRTVSGIIMPGPVYQSEQVFSGTGIRGS